MKNIIMNVAALVVGVIVLYEITPPSWRDHVGTGFSILFVLLFTGFVLNLVRSGKALSTPGEKVLSPEEAKANLIKARASLANSLAEIDEHLCHPDPEDAQSVLDNLRAVREAGSAQLREIDEFLAERQGGSAT